VPFVENGSSEFRVVHRGGAEDAEGENSQFEIRIRNISLWLIPFSKPLERLERLERFERLKPAQRGLLSG
jgi:hypothetical protein